jgi:hypoxanthine phosphoribosyltransferase
MPRGIWKCASPKTRHEGWFVKVTPPPVLFSAEQIQDRVRAMARQIASSQLVPDIAMPVLVGGFVFAADLIRALAWEGVPMGIEMIWLRSYGDKRAASAVSMIAGPSEQITGRHVLVVDGVLDAGRTIAKAISLIQAAGAASVQVAVMLDKQRTDRVASADYVGFNVGDDFVIGYGMDDAGRYRGLPYIGKV